MRNIVPWKELMECSEQTRYELLEERLGISREEAISVESPVEAGTLVLQKSIDLGLEKYEALGQLTTHTLAAITEDNFDGNFARRFSRRLKDRYGEKTADIPYIHFLRSEVFENFFGKSLEANHSVSGWDVDFSTHDLVRGTKLPFPIDDLSVFLCGVYNAIGHQNGSNQFYLCSAKNRVDFIDSIVKPGVRKVFNIDFEMNPSFVTKTSGFTDKTYTFENFQPTITSKAHSQFLKKYLLHVPDILESDEYCTSCIDERFRTYFAGVVSARGNLSRENNSLILQMINRDATSLENLAYFGQELGYNCTVKPKNNSYILRFPRKDVVRMAEENIPLYGKDGIFTDYKGVFSNPTHLQKLDLL